MHDRLFEAALGIAAPWFVAGVRFDAASRVLTVGIDYGAGSRFEVEGAAGAHPVYDTVIKTYRHLNFFQHECVLEVRTPRVKLPDGSVHLVKPPFAAVARIVQDLGPGLVSCPLSRVGSRDQPAPGPW
jgi:transposase